MEVLNNPSSSINLASSKFLMFALDEIANDLENNGNSVIRMTLGNSELPLNKAILNSMHSALDDPKKRNLVYPSGLPDLKVAISNYYSKKYKARISPDEIVISTGTSNLFRNIFQIILSKGGEVLLPRPYYPLYYVSAKILPNTKIKYYDINLGSMSIDFDSFEKNFSDKTKIVVLNSPGNPLGNIISKGDILKLDNIISNKAVIISDEIYENVCFESGFTSLLECGDNLKSFYIVTNAFSKGYKMYSRRVGWSIIKNNPTLVKQLSVLQEFTLLTADPIPQFGGIAALECQEDVKQLTKIYKERYIYATQKFESLSEVQTYKAKGGFYLTVNCENFIKRKGLNNCFALAKDLVEKTRVAVVPGLDFGLPNTIRLSFTTEKFIEGIDLLMQYFKN